MPKNDIVRRRGDYPGEAGADWGYGATARPEADEHYAQRQNREKPPGPLVQRPLREPATKEPREQDRQSRKSETDEAIKQAGKDDFDFPPDDESKFG